VASPGLISNLPLDIAAGLVGLDPQAQALIENSRSAGTLRNYDTHLTRWYAFCDQLQVNPRDTTLQNVLQFLSDLVHKNKFSTRTIGVARSAISMIHKRIEGHEVGQHPALSRLIKGCHNANPPQPRYAETWDIGKVLAILASDKYSPNETISIQKLQEKLLALLLFGNACRLSVLSRIHLSGIRKQPDKFIFNPSGVDKVSRVGKKAHQLLACKLEGDRELCPFEVTKIFLDRSKVMRTDHDNLFMSFKASESPASTVEMRVGIGKLLRIAGVPDQFKAHSVRGAATSHANKFLDTATILAAADWSNAGTFHTFYQRNVGLSKLDKQSVFQKTVLSKK